MVSYYDEYIKNNQKVIDAQKNAHLITRDSGNQIAAEKLAADNAALEESYGMQRTNTADTYDSALKKNEVQKVLNERNIERRMAEIGLTDSGLNRTQSTAVQLSYANQKGELIKQKQNALDTLAAALRSGQVQNQLTYNASVAQNNATYESNIASIDAQVAANASDYEAKMKQADIDAENARIRAQNEAIKEQYTSLNNLIEKLYDDDISNEAKQAYINNYILTHEIPDNLRRTLKDMGYITYPDGGTLAHSPAPVVDVNSAIKKLKIHPEAHHDAIMRDMYGSYVQYLAETIYNSNLTEDEKIALINHYKDHGYALTKNITFKPKK